MKSVVFMGGAAARVVDKPMPALRPGWALIRVKAAGICGSDLRMYRTSAEELGPRVGQTIGHEAAGVVEAVGGEIEALRPGARVMVYHYYSCGRCRHCLAGYRQLCPKAMGMAAAGFGSSAEYTLAPEANCLPLPEGLSFAAGAMMACCAATAFAALRKFDPAPGARLAILGMGPVGLCALLEAQAMGFQTTAIELDPARLAIARQFGAEAALDAANTDAMAELRQHARGGGFDCVLETSGAEAARTLAVEALRPQGKAVLVGLGPRKPARFDPYEIVLPERSVCGSFVFPTFLHEPFADFLLSKGIALDRVIARRFSLDQGEEAFRNADTGAAGKVIFEMP